jgi:hypothetical protein
LSENKGPDSPAKKSGLETQNTGFLEIHGKKDLLVQN